MQDKIIEAESFQKHQNVSENDDAIWLKLLLPNVFISSSLENDAEFLNSIEKEFLCKIKICELANVDDAFDERVVSVFGSLKAVREAVIRLLVSSQVCM